MDSLLELIDNRINKAMSQSSYINSQLGQVLEVNNGIYKVKLFTIGATYSIPNFSGSDIKEGQTVYVYWRGGFLSNQTAYIGATQSSANEIVYVYGNNTTIALSNEDTTISSFNLITQLSTVVTVYFNCILESSSTGTTTFTIILDDDALSYTPKQSIVEGYTHCSFVLPIELEETGNHFITIKANGVGNVTAIESFATGQGIIK